MDFGYILLPIFLFVAFIVLVATIVFWRQAVSRGQRRGLFLVSSFTLALFLLASGNCVRVFREEALVIAAIEGDAEAVRRELARGTNPESFYNSTTALKGAQERGHTEVVRLLKEAGARR